MESNSHFTDDKRPTSDITVWCLLMALFACLFVNVLNTSLYPLLFNLEEISNTFLFGLNLGDIC